MKRITPPAVCNAGNVTPSAERIAVPKIAKKSMIAVAMPVAFKEIARRSALLNRGEKEANRTAASTGPMVAKKVANADKAVSSIPPS